MNNNKIKSWQFFTISTFICILDITIFILTLFQLDYGNITFYQKIIIYFLVFYLFLDSFFWDENFFYLFQSFKCILFLCDTIFVYEYIVAILFLCIDTYYCSRSFFPYYINLHNKFYKKLLCFQIIIYLVTHKPILVLLISISKKLYMFFFKSSQVIIQSIIKWLNKPIINSPDISFYSTLYFSILVGLIGSGFTALSIISSKKQFSLSIFLKYGFASIFSKIILPIIVLINTIISIILLYCYKSTIYNYTFSFFIFAYIILFWTFGEYIKNFFTTDDEEKCFILFEKKLLHSKNNYKKLEDFYQYFIKPCFKNGRFEILDKLSSKTEKRFDKKYDFCKKYIIKLLASDFAVTNNSLRTDKLTKNDYIDGLHVFVKKLWQSLKQKDYQIAMICINNYITLYKKYTLKKSITHESYLLELRDPIYFILQTFQLSDKEDYEELNELKKLYIYIISKSSDLLVISMRNNTKKDFQNMLCDFIFFGQFFDQNINMKDISEAYYSSLIIIITWIIHSVSELNTSPTYISLIPDILKNVSTINIYDFDNQYYYSILPSINPESCSVTTNHYIAIMLILFFNESLLNKISYHNDNPEIKNWNGYNILLNEVEQIDYESVHKLDKNKTQEIFDSDKKKLITNLSLYITHGKELELKELKNLVTKEMILKNIKKQISLIYKDFSSLGNSKLNYSGDFTINTNISFSYKDILNYSTIHSFRTNYLNITKQPMLLPLYIRYAQIVYLNDISDINNIVKTSSLFIPNSLFDILFNTKMVEIGLNNMKIDSKVYSFEWIHCKGSGIIEEEAFSNFIKLDHISFDIENMKETVSENVDIIVSVPIIIHFSINKEQAYMYDFPQ